MAIEFRAIPKIFYIEIIFKNKKSALDINCSEMEILLDGDPKYIKHIKKIE